MPRRPAPAAVRAPLFVMLVCATLAASAAPQRIPSSAGGRHAQGRTLANGLVDPLQASATTRAVVLVFLSTECPYSNRSAPEIRRLYDAFSPRGVRFWLVYPNPAETPAIVRAHLKAFGYPDIALRDPSHALVESAKPTVTPEAVVFNAGGDLVYRGRIDDRVVELGRERPAPTVHDLENALTSVLAGRPVVPQTTQAFGCFLADLK
jgi:Redoxin